MQEYILEQRVFCEESECFELATQCVKEGRGQWMVVCDVHGAIHNFIDEADKLTAEAISKIRKVAGV